jgi:hypothetical protein
MYVKQEIEKCMLKTIILFLPVSMLGLVPVAKASIFGSFQQGYDTGKQNAMADRNNDAYNDDCPYNALTYVSYCLGYKSGYFLDGQCIQPSH